MFEAVTKKSATGSVALFLCLVVQDGVRERGRHADGPGHSQLEQIVQVLDVLIGRPF